MTQGLKGPAMTCASNLTIAPLETAMPGPQYLGTAAIEGAGIADQLHVAVSGTDEVNLPGLQARSANVTITSSGTVTSRTIGRKVRATHSAAV
jgi:hypothetical protein